MEKKQRTAIAAPTVSYSKGRHIYQKIKQTLPLEERKQIALRMLKEGRRTTAIELNRAIGFNDARRWITTLRRTVEGYVVRTVRTHGNRCIYWLERVEVPLNLFSGQEVADYEQ